MKGSSIPSHCCIAKAHMDRRMWVVLLITGLMATYVLWLFFRGADDGLSMKGRTTSEFQRQVPHNQGTTDGGVARGLPSIQRQGTPAARQILHQMPITPALHDLSVEWLLPEEKDPETRALLEGGISKMRHNDYEAARHELQRLINTYPDTKFAAPAYWAIGLAFYMEGGEGNLCEARDQFNGYVLFFPSGREYDDLAEAAQNNIAVIDVQLMQSNGSAKYAQTAVKSLQTFLDRYPYSPQAPAARLLLDEIQKTHANQP